jgi:hypothetical protein
VLLTVKLDWPFLDEAKGEVGGLLLQVAEVRPVVGTVGEVEEHELGGLNLLWSD